jgi:hypothetical protein
MTRLPPHKQEFPPNLGGDFDRQTLGIEAERALCIIRTNAERDIELQHSLNRIEDAIRGLGSNRSSAKAVLLSCHWNLLENSPELSQLEKIILDQVIFRSGCDQQICVVPLMSLKPLGVGSICLIDAIDSLSQRGRLAHLIYPVGIEVYFVGAPVIRSIARRAYRSLHRVQKNKVKH